MRRPYNSIQMRREYQYNEMGMPDYIMPSSPEDNVPNMPGLPRYTEDMNEYNSEFFNPIITPGLPNDVTPMLPGPNDPVMPGLPDDVMPMLPGPDSPIITPGLPNDVTPMLPGSNSPIITPGLPNDVTPMLPGSNSNITVIPIVPNLYRFAYVRFLNAAPSLGAVDIYVNGRLIVSGLKYRGYSDYLRGVPGSYRVAIYQAGTRNRPVLSERINIYANMIYTLAIRGTNNNLSLEMIDDVKRPRVYDMAYMRFIHMSPDAPAVDIYVDNKKVISDIVYGEVSGYLGLYPGEHSLTVKLAGTNTTVLENPSMTLKGGNYYSAYIVGYANGDPGLQVLIPLEGTSYLRF